MKLKIISIEKHTTDQACYLATLQITPSIFARWFGATTKTITFIGHHKHWYDAHDHSSAPRQVRNFLNRLFYSGEFRHLLVNIKAESKQTERQPHK
jgi:hypothetical protein